MVFGGLEGRRLGGGLPGLLRAGRMRETIPRIPRIPRSRASDAGDSPGRNLMTAAAGGAASSRPAAKGLIRLRLSRTMLVVTRYCQ
jgi:hypothetical protein